MQYFKSAQLYFKFLIARFDIMVISEHSLFKEQLGRLESCTGNTYNPIAVSASDNPPVLSGNLAHGGVALLWKRTLDDYISLLENISSDRIVGIQCSFPNKNLLFVLGVYLSSSKLEEVQEYFDHLWALYDSLSARRHVLILGDLNGDLGNSLGDKGSYEPNQRGLKLLDLAGFINLCPVNLLGSCSGPLES